MNIKKVVGLRTPDGHSIPAVLSTPEPARSGVVVLHPCGGSKEQMLGLACALGTIDVSALLIDSAGQGENRNTISAAALKTEVEAALSYMRELFERVGCAGAGLGGTLALLSSAEYVAAIAPAFAETSPEHEWLLDYFPQPGVRDLTGKYISELIRQLGEVTASDRPALIVSPEREIPEVAEQVRLLHQTLRHLRVHTVASDQRPDVDHESAVMRYMQRWLNHEEMRFNAEALEIAARWLAQMPGILDEEALVAGAEPRLHMVAKAGN